MYTSPTWELTLHAWMDWKLNGKSPFHRFICSSIKMIMLEWQCAGNYKSVNVADNNVAAFL